MAEEKKNQPIEEEEIIDLDAFTNVGVKQRQRYVKLNGVKYAITDLVDLALEDFLEILANEQTLLTAATAKDQMILARRNVEILVPSMPPEIIGRLTSRQIIQIGSKAAGAGIKKEDPQKGSEGESESGT